MSNVIHQIQRMIAKGSESVIVNSQKFPSDAMSHFLKPLFAKRNFSASINNYSVTGNKVKFVKKSREFTRRRMDSCLQLKSSPIGLDDKHRSLITYFDTLPKFVFLGRLSF